MCNYDKGWQLYGCFAAIDGYQSRSCINELAVESPRCVRLPRITAVFRSPGFVERISPFCSPRGVASGRPNIFDPRRPLGAWLGQFCCYRLSSCRFSCGNLPHTVVGFRLL